MDKQQLITELQSHGLKLIDPEAGAVGRKGGAGPSDHKAITIDDTTIMVPIYNSPAARSPYSIRHQDSVTDDRSFSDGSSFSSSLEPNPVMLLERQGKTITSVQFPRQPQFYRLTTTDGIPYWKIALLHGRDVLATTVLQTCMRYSDTATACQFCAIGQSLESGRTISRKTPAQLAEVAEAAVRLDDVKHMVMTTGTPNTSDRGAAYLTDCAAAIKAKVDLPIQAQCEPPDDFVWFDRLKAAGVDSLGMHLEAVDPQVRAQIMPGKATVPVEYYFQSFAAAVSVFGWGQVSTYLLAGLGDSLTTLLDCCDRLIQIGVYPFVVPFVPITGTPLAHHPAPQSELMFTLYEQVAAMLQRSGMRSVDIRAGCAKCGACSAMASFEEAAETR